jgi:outer membrane protein TolC
MMASTIAIFVFSALVARAQEQAAVALTVEEAVSRALATSQRLAESLAREDGAQAAIQSRMAAQRPVVSVSGGFTRTNHVQAFGLSQPNGEIFEIYPDIPDNYYTRATMQWPIYTGGRSDALIRAASAEARAAAADVDVARADLRLEVIRAYWALVTATSAVRVLEEALARADQHLSAVRSRFETGLIPPNEVSAVEAERSRQELQLIETRNLQSGALEDLRRLTGVPGEIVPAEPLAAPSGGQAAVAAGTANQRAELRALTERAAAADDRVQAIEAGRKPTLSVNGAADYSNPNPRHFPRMDRWRSSWEAGLVVNWTLWDGGRISAESAEARAASRALRARHADVQSLIGTEIRQRQLDVDSAHAALTAAETGVRSAAESRRVVQERFNVGVATSTDVTDAQVTLLQAELDRTRALASIRLAEARLERARGY